MEKAMPVRKRQSPQGKLESDTLKKSLKKKSKEKALKRKGNGFFLICRI